MVDVDGRSALHYAAYVGNPDLIDMLLSKGPLSTLNLPTNDLKTPLMVAVEFDHAEAVSLLLSAGASQNDVQGAEAPCPLRVAVEERMEKVLRVLASERGLNAVSDVEAKMSDSLITRATMRGASRILRLILLAEGEEKQQHWARHRLNLGVSLIHLAAGFGILANVKVLLAAGAHELERDPHGCCAHHNIGHLVEGGDPDPVEVAAIGRALQRGPTYRARSWAWPATADEKPSDRTRFAPVPLNVDSVRPGDPQLLGRLLRR